MWAARASTLSAVMVLAGAVGVEAAPLIPFASTGPAVRAAAACGPGGCFNRPFWRYGYGTGFRPFGGAGIRPYRPFAYPPFGLGRFGRGGGGFGGGYGGGGFGGRRY